MLMNAHPWGKVRERVEKAGVEWRPMMHLLDWIRDEGLEGEIFAHTSMHDVVFSDRPSYRNGENTLRVSWNPDEKKMRFCYDRLYASTDAMINEVSENNSIETLRGFLAHKFGVYRARKTPVDLPIGQVFPVFTPSSFFRSGNWFGPYQLCRVTGLGQTWAVFQELQTMRYVDRTMAAHWEAENIDWQARAWQNLRATSTDPLFTHEFRNKDGRRYAVSMMHADANGPARAMLREALGAEFPEGYLVGLPEMSCGVVLSKSATPEEYDQIAGMVTRCFSEGTRPLVDGLHEPSQIEASNK